MAELPSGTVTFLFTDLERSTSLWQDHPEAMKSALARHDVVVREAIEAHDGYVVKTTGDGFHAAFANPSDAVDAAIKAQVALAGAPWGETGALRVRIGIHSGQAELRDGDYYGTAVNRAARLMSVAHGGQIVVSLATAELVREGPIELVSLGEHRLRGLADAERVYQVSAPGLAAEFPPLQSLDALPGNLPHQVTTFVGREAEITSIAKLVRGSSLVTLTGVGGVGKTRLSLEVAAEVAPEFAGGAWFCEFAPVTDSSAVWETLAATLRVQSSPRRSLDESVLEYLTLKRFLLVLDNCEHLLSAIAGLVDAIVRRCPQVSVLATSREGLGLGGERMVAVPSLSVPADDADIGDLVYTDAVRLFEDRASAAKVDFAVTERNASAVAMLCRRLDGIPLAIELAAARVRSMSPEDLVSRLDQRFKLLTKGSRAALERQQTLRATIDWSYDLLDPTERRVLDRLSVFAGGCDLDAAEKVVAGDDLDAFAVDDLLGQLVDKSLVVADDTDRGVRYRLLETIRQYAQERLEAAGDTRTARAAHANYFAALAESNRAALRGRDQFLVAQHMADETDNFRAAIDYAIDTRDADLALRLVAPLAVRGPSIGYAAMTWAEAAIEIPQATHHSLFPEVASWATWSATARRDLPLAREYAANIDPAEAELGRQIAAAQRGPAVLAFFSGDYERVRVYCEKSAALARRDGDAYELAMALILLASAHNALGNHQLAFQTCEEAVQVARDAGTSSLAMGLNLLATLLPEESERMFSVLDEAITIGNHIGDPIAVAAAVGFKARVALSQGNNALALELAHDAIEREIHAGLTFAIGPPLLVAAIALTGLERFESAAMVLGTGLMFMPGPEPDRGEQLVTRAESVLVERLGKSGYDALRLQGAELSLGEVITTLAATLEGAV